MDPLITWEQELDRSVPLVTQYWAVVRNMYCPGNSRSRVTAFSEEELWAKIDEGRRGLCYADVIETGTDLVKDPEAFAAAKREAFRIRRTSCALPPPEDLAAIHAAKHTDPEDWDAIMAIDPSVGIWPETRDRLRQIQRNLKNDYMWRQLKPGDLAHPTHTP